MKFLKKLKKIRWLHVLAVLATWFGCFLLLDQVDKHFDYLANRASGAIFKDSGLLATDLILAYYTLIAVRKKRKEQKEHVAFLEAEMRKKLEQEEREAAKPHPPTDVR